MNDLATECGWDLQTSSDWVAFHMWMDEELDKGGSE